MNTIEDRIRAAARAAADTVPPDSVPPLRLPAGRARRRSRSSGWWWTHSRWARRLAPVTAAVAVVAVVVAAVVVGKTTGETARSAGGGAPVPSKMLAGPPISSYVASGQVPPYYVAITSHGGANDHPSYAVVHATVSGKTLATIQPSVADGTIAAVTAAADDRTFVLDEQPWTTTNFDQEFEARTFYEFRLSSSGQPGPLTRLAMSVPSGERLTGLALSPDGRKLAVAIQPGSIDKQPDLTLVKVYTLATGAVRTWTGHGTIGTTGLGADDAQSLSWASDERTLAFDWNGTSTGPLLPDVGVWLLHLDGRGSNLLTDSRRAVFLGGPARGPFPTACQEDLILTPDGSKAVCGVIQLRSLADTSLETEFGEYSTVTGKVMHILGDWTFDHVSPLVIAVLWSNSSGSVLIGMIPGAGKARIGVISGNSFTLLPAQVDPLDGGNNLAAPLSGTW